ncbi:hypothetical protein PV779_15490 [Streptomyces sp. ID01-9D]|nr:hypothetical protein [Streptomyces sp. ID01-9D]
MPSGRPVPVTGGNVARRGEVEQGPSGFLGRLGGEGRTGLENALTALREH